MRGFGVSAAVAGAIPPEFVPVFVVLTQLGDAWFLLSTPVIAYWTGVGRVIASYRDGLRLVAVAVAVLATVVALKHVFLLPRPPADVMNIAKDSYGFPSGHATGSAAVYGAGAALLTWRTRRDRVLLAAGLVALVCFTRLALGVHYVVDLVVGVPLGLVVAGSVLTTSRRWLPAGFWIAAVVGVAALVTTHVNTDAVAAFGVSLGAAITTTVIDARDLALSRPSTPAMLGGVAVAGIGGAAGFVVTVPLPVVFVATLLVGVVVAALPAKKELL